VISITKIIGIMFLFQLIALETLDPINESAVQFLKRSGLYDVMSLPMIRSTISLSATLYCFAEI